MEVTFIVSVIPIPALCLVPKSFGMFNFWDSGKKHPAYFISSYVMPLIEKGILAYTIPTKPKSKNQKIYTVE